MGRSTGNCGRVRFVERLEERWFLSSGDLDFAFGQKGVSSVSGATNGAAIAVQADGKTVLAFTGNVDGTRTLVVTRLKSDGAVDSTFGTKGRYSLAVGGEQPEHLTNDADVVIQGDGKIVVVASATLLRLTSSGDPDPAFGGGDGILTSPTVLTDISLDVVGNIIAGGGTSVRRYTSSGEVDLSFGGTGDYDISAVTKSNYVLRDVNVLSGDRIFVLGQVGSLAGNDDDFRDVFVTQLLPNGLLDSGFAGGKGFAALVARDPRFIADVPTASAVQGDGKIVIVESRDSRGTGLIFRLNADGSRDNSFGEAEGGYSDGTEFVFDGELESVAIQADGKIVVVSGSYRDLSEQREWMSTEGFNPTVVRLTTAGRYDQTFSYDGVMHLGMGQSATSVAIDAAGRIVVAGALRSKGVAAYVARVVTAGDTTPGFQRVNKSDTLMITGSTGADRIAVMEHYGSVFQMQLRFNNEIFYYSFDKVKRIFIEGGDGNDTAGVYMNMEATIRGGAGNDRIELWAANRTGAGIQDYAHGTIEGGAGDDYLRTGAGNDEIYGGTGNDTADYFEHAPFAYDQDMDLNISLDDLANDGEYFEKDNVHSDVENVLGDIWDDHIVGSRFNNRLIGGSGRDTLEGGAGNDSLDGGSGNDWVDGGVGTDILIGGKGTDGVSYSRRKEPLAIYLGRPKSASGAKGENDRISDTIENVRGGDGNDSIFGSERDNVLNGSGGKDLMYGYEGRDSLFGSSGDDKIFGGDDNDSIEGGSGNDTVSGDRGSDTMWGQSGKDLLLGLDQARDIVNGGASRDRATRDAKLDQVVSVETV